MTDATLQLLIDNIMTVLLLAGGGLLLVSFLFFMIYIFIKKVLPLLPKLKKVSTPAGSFELAGDEAEPIGEIKCETCTKEQQFFILLMNQNIMLDKVHKIEKSILKDQMKIVESSVVRITNYLQHMFSDLITVFMEPPYNILDNVEYESYIYCLEKIESLIRFVCRERFQDDEIEKMSEAKYKEYVDGAIIIILKKSSERIDDYYHGKAVPRSRLKGEEKNTDPFISNILTTLFLSSRDISIEAVKNIETLKHDFSCKVQQVFNDRV